MRLASPSPEHTRAVARLLADAVGECGLVVCLVGPLGAGKTVFAKGLAEGLGVDPARVTSPSFVIASEYPSASGRHLAHVDWYRLESVAELEATGFEELLDPGGVVVVEWADRFPEALPPDRLEIEISRPPPAPPAAGRVLHALSCGPVSQAALARWHEALAAFREGPGADRE